MYDKPFDKLAPIDQMGKLNRLAEILKVSSHPVRLSIIKLLEDGELPVNMMVYDLSLPYPTISRHLKYLHRARIVANRREGTIVYYYLNDDRILELINDTRP